MKLLVIGFHNPETEQMIRKSLEPLGVRAIFCAYSEEAQAYLELYGHQLIGALGKDYAGASFVAALRKHPKYSKMGFILWANSTNAQGKIDWSLEKCKNHSQSSEFAHAYLPPHFDQVKLFTTLDQVLGTNFSKGSPFVEPKRSIEAQQSIHKEPTKPQAKIDSTQTKLKKGIAPVTVEAAPVHEATSGGGISLSDFSDSLEMEGHSLNSTEAKAPEVAEVKSIELNQPAQPIVESQGLSISVAPTQEEKTKTGQTVTGVTGESLMPSQPGPESLNEPKTQSNSLLRPDKTASLIENLKIPDELAPVDEEEPLYLNRGQSPSSMGSFGFALPSEEALIPGLASQAPDEDTLKKYLLLREQDVVVLSNQLKQAKEQIFRLEQQVKQAQAIQSELQHVAKEQQGRIDDFEKEKAHALEMVRRENFELQFDLKKKLEDNRSLEIKNREAARENERIKERIRVDIRKIRVREKELENKLEVLKRDTDALLATRESRLIELKRRMDILEFNNDLLHDQLAKEKGISQELRNKLEKASQMVRLAKGLLEPNQSDGMGLATAQDSQEGPSTGDSVEEFGMTKHLKIGSVA